MSKNRLIFSNAGTDRMFVFEYIDDKLETIEYLDEVSIIDNIYLGVVDSIAKGINASFVRFSDSDTGKGFLLNDREKPFFINNKNTDKICQGDKFPVQITNDRIKTKDYSLTCNLSIKGENLIIYSEKNNINISKKITDTSERDRIKTLLKSNFPEYGFLVRTSAAKCDENKIIEEANKLAKHLQNVYSKAKFAKSMELLWQPIDEKVRISTEFLKKYRDGIIICNSKCDYNMLSGYFNNNADSPNSDSFECNDFLRCYSDDEINLMFNVRRDFNNSLHKKVWLKSGAYLVIEPTEALNVIDVNSGKAVKKADRDKSFLDINLEAADAVCAEIKKRNLGGIIIVDFINMQSKEYNDILLKHMEKLALKDSMQMNVHGFTQLGLMELTRKKKKKQLHELDLFL